MGRSIGLRGLALTLACVGTAPARAELVSGFLGSEIPWEVDRGENIGVLDRQRPELASRGINLGGFKLNPSLTVGTGYNSNVYGQTGTKTGDFYAIIFPSANLTSNWSRHSVSVQAAGDFLRYKNETARNESGYNVQGSGRVDIGDSEVYTSARLQRVYQPQYAGDFPIDARESIQYLIKSATVRGTYQGARFRVIGSGDINRVTYRNARTLSGGILDQKSRDRKVFRSSGRLEFAATPDKALFAQLTYSDTRYDRATTSGGADNRDAKEYRAIGGAIFDLSHFLRGRVGVGYTVRNYDSPIYPTVKGLAADANLTYFLTTLTNITVGASRQVNDSNTVGSGGYIVLSGNVRVDHELLRNLLLNVSADYQRATFNGIDRRDNTYLLGAGANYLTNRNLKLGLDVSYISKRTKGGGGSTYKQALGLLSATVKI